MSTVRLDELFTAEEAAAEVGVEPATIYTWVSRGYLAAAPEKRGRNKLFVLDDVFTAEARRKRKHRRKRP